MVENGALIAALQAGKIAAALDVFHAEPVPADDPLLELATVVTPHNAGTTAEATEAGLKRAVENVERYLRGSPRDVVVA